MIKFIESERLILRKFKLSDVKPYFNMTQDKSIQDYVPYVCATNYFRTFMRVLQFIHGNSKDNYYIALEEKNSKKIIGAIVAIRTQQKNFDMNILLDSNSRRKRYMSEALTAFIKIMPQNSELVFVIDKTNTASLNTVSKLPNIKEVPFTGYIGKLMSRYSLTVSACAYQKDV